MNGESFKKDYAGMMERIAKEEQHQERPPHDYDLFVNMATDIMMRKDTDYGSRFMRGLDEHGGGIWGWEVAKKLDRIRTWIERGQLEVKGEGITNSVVDLFVYTVQYYYHYSHPFPNTLEKWAREKEALFYSVARCYEPSTWVNYLVEQGLIKDDEVILQNILRLYMGDEVGVTDWKEAIKQILTS